MGPQLRRIRKREPAGGLLRARGLAGSMVLGGDPEVDLERVAYNVISHFAIAAVVIMAFLISHALAERYRDWRSRAVFFFELLVTVAASAFFWGASAHPNMRLESGAEAALTLLIPSAVAIVDVW